MVRLVNVGDIGPSICYTFSQLIDELVCGVSWYGRCQVVTYGDMMKVLTDYTYAIGVTSDANGKKETWGAEVGYGIISADQMLGWIATNCQEACPGEEEM